MPALATLPEKAPVVHVLHDHGGAIFPYQVRVARWRRSGTKIRINGECASACTLALSLPTSQVCVTKNAVLGFHEGSDRLATTLLWQAYPASIKNWLDKENAADAHRREPRIPLTATVHWLTGKALRQTALICK